MEVGMVFALVFALLFIGFLFVFGGQAIANLFTLGGQATLQQTVKNLEQAVNNVYNLAEGSTQPFSFSLPGGARICFLTPPNYAKRPEYGWNPEELTVSQFLQNPVSPDYQKNIWLYEHGNDRFGKGYNIEAMATGFNTCRSSAQLLLENRGAAVFITVA